MATTYSRTAYKPDGTPVTFNAATDAEAQAVVAQQGLTWGKGIPTPTPSGISNISADQGKTPAGGATSPMFGIEAGTGKGYQFADVLQTAIDRMNTINPLTNARQLLIKHMYDSPLTQDEISKLPTEYQTMVNTGDKQELEMGVRLLNDQISNRMGTLDQSVKFLTQEYDTSQTNLETQRNNAIDTVLKFVGQYGSQASSAMKTLYGQNYLDQLKTMGIDIDAMAALPTISETRYQAQYGGTGAQITIPSGSLATVNNNPGNLKFANQSGATQGQGGFAAFSTPGEGYQALINDITAKQLGMGILTIPDGSNAGSLLTGNSSLEDMMRVYAPTADNNDPVTYAKEIADALGITPQTPINQISAQDLAEQIAKVESGTSVVQPDIVITGQMLASGETAPSLVTGMGGQRNKAIAEAKRIDPNYNAAQAEIQFQASKRFATSLNSAQMVRFFGLAKSVVNTIDEVKRLSEEVKNSGVVPLNALKLQAYVKVAGNTPMGQTVAQYLGAVNTLKEEFANLAQGGYAPTEATWTLANKQINENYGVDELGASLTEVQRLINFRVNAISGLQPIIPGATGTTGTPTTGADNDPLNIR